MPDGRGASFHSVAGKNSGQTVVVSIEGGLHQRDSGIVASGIKVAKRRCEDLP
jgi:hypothetical protein